MVLYKYTSLLYFIRRQKKSDLRSLLNFFPFDHSSCIFRINNASVIKISIFIAGLNSIYHFSDTENSINERKTFTSIVVPGKTTKFQYILKYKVCSKSVETKAVFIKTEMNNEWNINFLRNTKLHSKRIETEAVYLKTEMNNEQNINFLQNTKLHSKGVETDVVYLKTEMNTEWNINFLQNCHFDFVMSYFFNWPRPS